MMRRMVAILVLLAVVASGAGGAEVSAEAVEREIGRLVERIKSQQRGNGSWQFPGRTPGFTALNVLALATAGLKEEDPAVGKAVQYLRRNFPAGESYGVGLYACAFEAVDPSAYWAEIRRAADWLVAHQHSGTWNYQGTFKGDNSVTQFAMLGIKAAMDANVPVPERVLQANERHFRGTQNGDGGWGYRGKSKTMASMTPAALSSLHVCGVELEKSLELEKGPEFLGQYETDPTIARGIGRMVKQMELANPYTAYGIERVGIFYDQRQFKGVDWYREGCRVILSGKTHDGVGAGLGFGKQSNPHCPDQFKLLFLAKGNVPLLVGKARWGGESADWNNRHNDVRNMVRHLARLFTRRLDWQTVSLRREDPDLARVPLLYLSGFEPLTLTESEQAVLQDFIAAGGTVLLAPNQGSRRFIRSCVELFRRLFPGSRFAELSADHPLRGMYYDLYDQEVPLRVLEDCCIEQRVFITLEDLSLEFEQPKANHSSGMVAANLARFALEERPLFSRLAPVELASASQASGVDAFAAVTGSRPGGLAVAQVRYQGTFRPNAQAMVNFQGFLREALGIPTALEPVEVGLTDPLLGRHGVLYVTGHEPLPLSGAEKGALKDYLEKGGFLMADARCSREEFDRGFRALMKGLFPGKELEPVPRSSPVYHEPFALQPAYTPAMETLFKARPEYLWGLRLEERWVVLYSPGDLGYSMDRKVTDRIPCYTAPSSFRIMANMLSYGLSY